MMALDLMVAFEGELDRFYPRGACSLLTLIVNSFCSGFF